MKPISEGSLVRLKSGGPSMVVRGTNERNEFICCWFEGETPKEMPGQEFLLECLEEVGSGSEDTVSEYAQKLISTPTKQDGLYWETLADEEPSPLGPLVAYARTEGYTRNKEASTQSANPFHVTTSRYLRVRDRVHPAAPTTTSLTAT